MKRPRPRPRPRIWLLMLAVALIGVGSASWAWIKKSMEYAELATKHERFELGLLESVARYVQVGHIDDRQSAQRGTLMGASSGYRMRDLRRVIESARHGWNELRPRFRPKARQSGSGTPVVRSNSWVADMVRLREREERESTPYGAYRQRLTHSARLAPDIVSVPHRTPQKKHPEKP
jgi:hypothetical protein